MATEKLFNLATGETTIQQRPRKALAAEKEAKRDEVLAELVSRIDAIALAGPLDADDMATIERGSKLAAATIAYLLASASAPYRTAVGAARTNARSLLAAINAAGDLATLDAIDISAGWPA